MYLLHCTECHHEWESPHEQENCNWCHAPSYVLTTIKPFNVNSILNHLRGKFVNKDKKK